MSGRRKTRLGIFAGLLLAAACGAQAWGVGASIGVVDDVKNRLHLDEFKSKDVNAWVDFQPEEKVFLRATFGSLTTKGVNAGQTAAVGSTTVTLPDLTDKIDYATIGASYEFWEGYYTSGLFAGIGAYRIRPELAAAGLEGFRDQREQCFGWHIGVDGSFTIVSRLALGVRITYHSILATVTKPLITANAGLSYRF